MLKKLLSFLKQEPVRVRLYTVLGLVLAALVAKGVISDNDVLYILSIAAAVLGVENLRSKVSPVVAPEDPDPPPSK